jgi:hypothetical protein
MFNTYLSKLINVKVCYSLHVWLIYIIEVVLNINIYFTILNRKLWFIITLWLYKQNKKGKKIRTAEKLSYSLFFLYILWVVYFLIYQMCKSSDFWYRLIFWWLHISNSLILSLHSSVFPLILNFILASPMIMIGFFVLFWWDWDVC